MLRSDVLPAPFGPMIEINSPRSTASATSSTARTPPKCFETSDTVSCTLSEGVPLPFKLSDTLPPAFPHPPAAHVCTPLMAGMMQTHARYGNGYMTDRS